MDLDLLVESESDSDGEADGGAAGGDRDNQEGGQVISVIILS